HGALEIGAPAEEEEGVHEEVEHAAVDEDGRQETPVVAAPHVVAAAGAVGLKRLPLQAFLEPPFVEIRGGEHAQVDRGEEPRDRRLEDPVRQEMTPASSAHTVVTWTRLVVPGRAKG